MKRQIFLMLLCVVLLSAFCLQVPVYAAASETFTLRVGYVSDYGITRDVNGKLSGYLYSYMNKIAQINDWNIEFIACDWAEGVELLKNKKLDVFGPMQKTAERERYLDFPDQAMGYERSMLCVRSDNSTIFYGDLESLRDKTFGGIAGTQTTDRLVAFCADKEIPIRLREMNSISELDQAFAAGSIDVRIASDLQASGDSKVVLYYDNDEFYFPTAKGNDTVLKGMNTALAKIKQENVYYNANLYAKYYGDPLSAIKAFTEAENNYVNNAPILKAGYLKDNAPLEYYNEKTNSAAGANIDLLRLISAHSGLHFELVAVDSFEQAVDLLQQDKIDLILGVAASTGAASHYQLKLTQPTIETNLVFILEQGVGFDPSSAIFAVPRGALDVRQKVYELYPYIPVITYNTLEQCLDAVLQGNASFTVTNMLVVDNILAPPRFRTLTVNSASSNYLPICIAVPEDSSDTLVSIINKSITSIDDDARNQIMYRYTIGMPYQMTFGEMVRSYYPVFIGVFAIFLLILYWFSLRSRKQLNQLAFYDPLTGEMNLNKFKIEAEKIISRNSNNTYAIAVIDIDKFKSINDIYGYAFGDVMLQHLAAHLHKSMEKDMLLCRGNADRFDLFFRYQNEGQVRESFQHLADSVEAFPFNDRVTCHIVLSCGVCVIRPGEVPHIISIIDRANIARKSIKPSHASTLAFYDQSMYDKLNHTKKIENSMHAALENNEFIVYFQPKIDLATRRVVGAEALVRWQKPNHELIPPIQFIPLFEENGFIVELDFYIFEQVCRVLDRWKKRDLPLFTISVNLSRRHLTQYDTMQTLTNILSQYDVDPKYIEIELTESTFVDCDVQTIRSLLNNLHSCGFTVSVDDFGSGYSSLSLLKDLPIDVLKIDKSFFDSPSDSTDKVECLLESVISLSRKLHIKTVSEGVETQQQVDLLLLLGCDLAQGFYFARPMPTDQLEQFLQSGGVSDGLSGFTEQIVYL